tara:strand:- start:16 stop:249 length:234 start_codon:yes stop_codon:yes gene_type:complete
MAKISQILSILSFIISASILGAGVYGYKMVTSDKGQEKIKNIIVDNIKENMPNLINKQIPKFTQPATPTKPKSSINL